MRVMGLQGMLETTCAVQGGLQASKGRGSQWGGGPARARCIGSCRGPSNFIGTHMFHLRRQHNSTSFTLCRARTHHFAHADRSIELWHAVWQNQAVGRARAARHL